MNFTLQFNTRITFYIETSAKSGFDSQTPLKVTVSSDGTSRQTDGRTDRRTDRYTYIQNLNFLKMLPVLFHLTYSICNENVKEA